MLTISGLKNFYFLPSFHDMRCKAPRISEIKINKGMNESELRDFVRFQYNQIIEKDKINQEILGELREMRQDYKELLSKFDSLTLQLEKERLENRDLKEQIGVLKNKLYRR